jgi:hypothetical protein
VVLQAGVAVGADGAAEGDEFADPCVELHGVCLLSPL